MKPIHSSDIPIADVSNISPAEGQLLCGGYVFSIIELSTYGFVLGNGGMFSGISKDLQGELRAGGESLTVRFRVRSLDQEICRCVMPDLSLIEQKAVAKMAQILSDDPKSDKDNALQSLSYDQLASGQKNHAAHSNSVRKPAGAPSKRVALVAVACAIGIIVILGVAATLIIRSGSVELNNGALIGDYLPMSAEEDGFVTHIFVSQNETVKAGQPLFRVNSRLQSVERENLRMELTRTQAEHHAQEMQLSGYGKRFDISEKVLEKDMLVARASLHQTEVALKNATALVEKLKPLTRSGAISDIELQVAVANQDLYTEERSVRLAEIERLQLSLDAAEEHVLVGEGGRLDDQLAQLELALTLAKAHAEEAERKLEFHDAENAERTILASETGKVYSVYASVGQFVKAGQAVVSIGMADSNYAIGHLSSEDALRVRPGQVVQIDMPSIGMETEGEIIAVGHRGLYNESGWSNDFRGELPTDIPVKILLPDKTLDLPSGLRLKMAVDVGRIWPWEREKIAEQYRKQPKAPVEEVAVEAVARIQ